MKMKVVSYLLWLIVIGSLVGAVVLNQHHQLRNGPVISNMFVGEPALFMS
jgi:hypothetical protein